MTAMTPDQLQRIIEAALFVSGQPLTLAELQKIFPENEQPTTSDLKNALEHIEERHKEAGIELKEVASGYRLQAKSELSPWLSRLWEERAPRYSRAFLETLAIIAYKQPITRAEIEEIRGVTVSSHIIKTMLDREWVRVVGHRDIPGKPAILGTTKGFLDYFNLKSLTDLPTLAEFKNLEAQEAQLQIQLALEESDVVVNAEEIPQEQAIVLDESTDSNVIPLNAHTLTEEEIPMDADEDMHGSTTSIASDRD